LNVRHGRPAFVQLLLESEPFGTTYLVAGAAAAAFSWPAEALVERVG
jgi:hypothetical protein